jgi:hypothetical protein
MASQFALSTLTKEHLSTIVFIPISKEYLIMDNDDFERLNFLSEKAITKTATKNELKEFNILLNEWNSSEEFNLFNENLKAPLK